MKIKEPKVQILLQSSGLEGVYKQIEICGRTCYKSEDKITDTSAKPFVERMMKSQHYAMLEHGTIYLKANCPEGFIGQTEMVERYKANPYSVVKHCGGTYLITTNYRVIVENGWFDDLEYMCEPTPCHEMRISVKFRTQIAVTREMNRHRVNSIAESSTRYCNYTKDKFGGEISIIRPEWQDGIDYTISHDDDFLHSLASDLCNYKSWSPVVKWWFANAIAEKMYLSMIEEDELKPQDARTILPLDTSTEIVHTAFLKDWRHFFDLRSKGTTGKPHPDILRVARELENMFETLGLV